MIAHRVLRLAVVLLAPTVLAGRVWAATVNVANNGVDGPTCGPTKSPCRSIGQAIANAAAGDKIVVGPGAYGDLNHDGTLGDSPGEENPDVNSPGCSCMLAVNKPVTVFSSAGAAATVIDAETVAVSTNVLLITGPSGGGAFGKRGAGFTVTNTSSTFGDGIVVDSTNVKIAGNEVISRDAASGVGVLTVDAPEVVAVEANHVTGWGAGIRALGANKTVRQNDASKNCSFGISVEGGSSAVVGNVTAANGHTGSGAGTCSSNNGQGIFVVSPDATVVGNASYANVLGIEVFNTFSGTLSKNDVFGNTRHGLQNDGQSLNATNNYWGAPTGPGPDPADDVVDVSGGVTTTTPFATKPFKVKAPIML